jgi:hypothetical protein
MANFNRRNNSIDFLLIDDIISTNRAEINKHIVQFYQKLYTKQFSLRPVVDDLLFDSIDEAKASWWERDFENDDKASGPDSFSMAFFQASWVVFKEDIMKFSVTSMLEESLRGALMLLLSPSCRRF